MYQFFKIIPFVSSASYAAFNVTTAKDSAFKIYKVNNESTIIDSTIFKHRLLLAPPYAKYYQDHGGVYCMPTQKGPKIYIVS